MSSEDWGAALILLAVFIAIVGGAMFCGCVSSAPTRAENAAVNATYGLELDACILRGKRAQSLAVYEACAASLDGRLCAERGVRCFDGGAP